VKGPHRARLAKRIKKLRLAKKISQEALALSSGLHRNVPGKLERGQHDPTFTTLVKLAHGFGISLSELLKGI